MSHHLDTKHWLATAPRAWFDAAWRHVFQHKDFRACNNHLSEREYNTLVHTLVWPKDVQVFTPYEPTTAGYTQVTLPVPNPVAPAIQPKKKVCNRMVTPPSMLHTRFSLHVLACVYFMRFLREPAMSRFSSTMMGAALRKRMQASHTMETIEMAAMGINPHFMVLEGGEVNKSRRACTMAHAKMEFLVKHIPGMGPRCEEVWDNHVVHMGPHAFLPKETHVAFHCNNPQLHHPPCRGWDHNKRHIPALVARRWEEHVTKVQQERARVQGMTPKQEVANQLQKANKRVASLRKKLRKMQLEEQEEMRRMRHRRPM